VRKGIVKKDIVGSRHGCFEVTDEYRLVPTKCGPGKRSFWKCICTRCGNTEFLARNNILSNKHEYCSRCRPHGIRHERLYHIYHGILQRCNNKNSPSYNYYGAKGVKMCDEWVNGGYEAFKTWAYANGYQPDAGLSIDRLDADRDYEPANCEWVTIQENTRRGDVGKVKSHSKLQDVYAISPSGERIEIKNIAEFCRIYDLNSSSVHAALHGRIGPLYHGWTFHSNESR